MSSFAPLDISSANSLLNTQLAPPTPSPSIFGSPTNVDPKQDSLDMLNATLQLHWADRLGNSLRFKSISVFLIYWAERIDELKCAEEVFRLEKFFQTKFGYKTHLIEIQSSERADLQVQMELSKLIYDNDDEDNLHIVYYAGHGIPISKDADEIAFVPHSDPAMRMADTLHLQWTTIEQTLAKAHGHRLCILDCCYSGNIARSGIATSQDHRNFEILSASSYGGTTRGPGKHSFTSALMWALEDLLDEFKGRGFTTTHLRLRIRAAPEFPRTQHPAPVKEINSYARSRIVLHPLNGERSRANTSESGAIPISPQHPSECSIGRYVVNLRFFFEDKPDKAKIDELAVSVKRCREEVVGLRGVGWDGLEQVGSAQRAIIEHFNEMQHRDSLKREYSKPFLALLKSRKSDPGGGGGKATSRIDLALMNENHSHERRKRQDIEAEDIERWMKEDNGGKWPVLVEGSAASYNEKETTTTEKLGEATKDDGNKVSVLLVEKPVIPVTFPFLLFFLIMVIVFNGLLTLLLNDRKSSWAK